MSTTASPGITITFIEPGGRERPVLGQPDTSLMQLARANNIEGVVAECGGACDCGACQVIIDEAWIGRIRAPSSMERAILACSEIEVANSRLSCQIAVSPALEGIVVRVSEHNS